MYEKLSPCAEVIKYFAEACERMNEYSRNLRAQKRFGTVRTGADIRKYESGSKLEKFIEGELNSEEGLWAVWWLELSASGGEWVVSSNVSISHSDEYFDFEDRRAGSPEKLKICLEAAVLELESALDSHPGFAASVKAAL